MGAGKSHVLKHLHSLGLFPLQAFVNVDPDELRATLPEFAEYCRRNPAAAGRLTQKEVGYISEVLTLNALEEGKNALVDGTLRDAGWYDSYITKLKALFPKVRIAIIQITATKENVLSRALKRAEKTGRLVPEETILSAIESIPASVNALKKHADFVAVFENNETPVLIKSSTGLSSLAEFKDMWKMTCRMNQPKIRKGSVGSLDKFPSDSSSSVVSSESGSKLPLLTKRTSETSREECRPMKRLSGEFLDPSTGSEDSGYANYVAIDSAAI